MEPPEGLDCRFLIPDTKQTEKMNILIVAVRGEYPEGSKGNYHGNYIACMSVYGLLLHDPDCIIFDFSEMYYTWGNTLIKPFQDISQFRDADKEENEPAFPILAVTSRKCREAFLSLMTVAGEDEPEWHFGDLNKAIRFGVKAAKKWLDY